MQGERDFSISEQYSFFCVSQNGFLRRAGRRRHGKAQKTAPIHKKGWVVCGKDLLFEVPCSVFRSTMVQPVQPWFNHGSTHRPSHTITRSIRIIRLPIGKYAPGMDCPAPQVRLLPPALHRRDRLYHHLLLPPPLPKFFPLPLPSNI